MGFKLMSLNFMYAQIVLTLYFLFGVIEVASNTKYFHLCSVWSVSL